MWAQAWSSTQLHYLALDLSEVIPKYILFLKTF